MKWAAIVLAATTFDARDVLKEAGVIQSPSTRPAPAQPSPPVKLECRTVDYIFETKVICEEKR